MTRFRFSLQTVLDVRKRREEGAQLELAQAVVARQQAARAVQEEEQRLERALAGWDALARAGQLDPALWLGQARYAARVRRERDAARQRYAAAEQEEDAARERLVAAARDRQVLETLRERELARHRAALARAEAARLDEVGTIRFRFARRESTAAWGKE